MTNQNNQGQQNQQGNKPGQGGQQGQDKPGQHSETRPRWPARSEQAKMNNGPLRRADSFAFERGEPSHGRLPQ